MTHPPMAQPLWTAAELCEATGGTMRAPFEADGVSIDTRTLQPGDLFVALVGEGRDGHAFVAEALAKGAAGAMVHRDLPGTERVLRVDDTLGALGRLGGFARARSTASQVAVTGSVGKTSTKEMLRGALAVFGPTHAAVASYNNHWGVPLTLARMPRDTAFCVAEIGMNHAGEIAPLAHLVRPHVTLITNIEKAHVGHLGSIEAIADEKASIIRGLEPGGIAVLPADSPLLPRLQAQARGARMLTFGQDSNADVRLLHIEAEAEASLINVNVAGLTASLHLHAPGMHMALNAVAALAVVAALGLSPAEAIEALEAFRPLSGRGARRVIDLPDGSALLLDESYNANGASVRAALDVLRAQPARRRIAVLGDMLELGDDGPGEHAGLAAAVAGSVDLLFTCGPLMRGLFEAVPAHLRGAHAPDSAALAPMAAAVMGRGDAILVKGSLGSGMKTVIEAIEAMAQSEPAGSPEGLAGKVLEGSSRGPAGGAI